MTGMVSPISARTSSAERRVVHSDGVGPARRTREGFRQRLAQHAPDGAVEILGHDHGLADDEPLRQLEPDHHLGTVRLLPIEDVEGGCENAGDPLSTPGSRTDLVLASRPVAPALHVSSPSVMVSARKVLVIDLRSRDANS